MNRIRVFLCIVLLLLVSCGRQDDHTPASSERVPVSTKEPKEEQGQTRPKMIYLNPPYTDWQKEETDTPEKIRLEDAVSAVLKQAGIRFNSTHSHQNIESVGEELIAPVIKEEDWRSALDQILRPLNLSYYVENYNVTLVTAAQAAKRAQVRQEILARVDQFVSRDHRPERLPGPVIVFPLLDANEKTTEAGTMLSLLGMLKATYAPKKVLDLHFPGILSFYQEHSYMEDGQVVSPAERERILKRLGADTYATGTFELSRGSSFRITLNFDGEHGPGQFVKDGGQQEIADLPAWIAECIHQYCRLDSSLVDRESLAFKEFSDLFQLHRMLELDGKYRMLDRSYSYWTEYVRVNPYSLFSRYRSSFYGTWNADVYLERIARWNAQIGDNDFVHFIEADFRSRSGKYIESVSEFLQLLEHDFRNEAIYEKLDDILLAMDAGKSAVALHDFWRENDSDSYLPYLAEGSFSVDYAWELRGVGWGWTVSQEARDKFDQQLQKAGEYLKRAYELNPSDPRAATKMIVVTMGLGRERTEMEKWFSRAINADPTYYPAYRAKLYYLLPIWQGNEQEVFLFARSSAHDAPAGSRIRLILVDAHERMSKIWARPGMQIKDYYKLPGVWEEIKPIFETFLASHPDVMEERNRYAKYAYYAGDYTEAVQQFKIIDRRQDPRCWSEDNTSFYSCRDDAYDKAGEIQLRTN
jgi:tetratricopeptide (TPR) repeat protein